MRKDLEVKDRAIQPPGPLAPPRQSVSLPVLLAVAAIVLGVSVGVFLEVDLAAGIGTALAGSGVAWLLLPGGRRSRAFAWGLPLVVGGAAFLVLGAAIAPASKPKPAPKPAVSTSSNSSVPAPSVSASLTLDQQRVLVREAYLKFWDVVAQTALSHDPAPLNDVAGGQVLEYAQSALAHDTSANQTWLIKEDHDIRTITVVPGLGGPGLGAQVDDYYIDHTVLVDPQTLRPLQSDPNQSGHQSYTLKEVAPGQWKVFFGSRIH